MTDGVRLWRIRLGMALSTMTLSTGLAAAWSLAELTPPAAPEAPLQPAERNTSRVAMPVPFSVEDFDVALASPNSLKPKERAAPPHESPRALAAQVNGKLQLIAITSDSLGSRAALFDRESDRFFMVEDGGFVDGFTVRIDRNTVAFRSNGQTSFTLELAVER